MAQNRWLIEEGMALVTQRMAQGVRDAQREAAREEGLGITEMQVLMSLDNGWFDTARDICRVWSLSRSQVSKAVDQLTRRGYVQARQDQADRRVMHLALQPAAEPVLAKMSQAKERFIHQMVQGVTEEEFDAFDSMAKKVAANLQVFPEASAKANEQEQKKEGTP